MSESILDLSRQFFHEIVLPLLERNFPEETRQGAFGLFGYGSDAIGLDDQYSRDHHWGLRIDGLVPDALMAARVPDSMWSIRCEIGCPTVVVIPETLESSVRKSSRNSSLPLSFIESRTSISAA